jgi:hypothetical protein
MLCSNNGFRRNDPLLNEYPGLNHGGMQGRIIRTSTPSAFRGPSEVASNEVTTDYTCQYEIMNRDPSHQSTR